MKKIIKIYITLFILTIIYTIPLNVKMQRVVSSKMKYVGYKESDLYIQFCDRQAYRYFDVPEEKHRELLLSPFKEHYYEKNIKLRYRYKKMIGR